MRPKSNQTLQNCGASVTVTICESSDEGHRLGYVTYLRGQAERLGQTASVEPLLRRAACSAHTLVLPMLEQRAGANLLTIALRALLGRRTVCLVFRARDAVRSRSWRHAIKRASMAAVKRLPGAALISIVPVPVEPDIAGIVTDWIYDPELCDLDAAALNRVPAPAIAELRQRAGGRTIVAALGRQDRDKGFVFFCELWAAHPELRERCLFVAAGGVPDDLTETARRFAAHGGVLMDGFIDDDTLFDLYAVADAIWCCYAPRYDQASGIFGRAVQFGRTALVRRGSHVERFAAVAGHPAAAIGWDDTLDAARVLLQLSPAAHPQANGLSGGDMRGHNEGVFQRYLLA